MVITAPLDRRTMRYSRPKRFRLVQPVIASPPGEAEFSAIPDYSGTLTLIRRKFNLRWRDHEDAIGYTLHAPTKCVGNPTTEVDHAALEFTACSLEVDDHRLAGHHAIGDQPRIGELGVSDRLDGLATTMACIPDLLA